MTEGYESNMELTGSEPVEEITEEVVETPAEESPSEVEEATVDENPTEEVTPEEVLYETPDGRKVNAAVLQKEWKENFLPEFTRKSQRLAELERGKDLTESKTDEPEWKSPDYVPQTYAEVIEIAKQAALQEIENKAKSEAERSSAIEKAVDEEINAIKALDPQLNESELFQHANKYGFQSLKAAHINMKDMRNLAVTTEQRTVKNLKSREADPVSAGNSGDLPDSSGYDPNEMSRFEGAAEYLAHLNGKK